MKGKKKENDPCCLSSGEAKGKLPRRCFHLQEVKGDLDDSCQCFHLDAAAAGQMVACGQIQAGILSSTCDEEEEQMQNKTCLPLENIASAC